MIDLDDSPRQLTKQASLVRLQHRFFAGWGALDVVVLLLSSGASVGSGQLAGTMPASPKLFNPALTIGDQ
jgi:hypothetical protein